MSAHEPSPEEKVKMLERRANVVRSRLFRAVDALDARRHRVVELGDTARKIAGPASLVVLGIAGLFGASAIAFGLAVKKRRRPPTLGSALGSALRGLVVVRPPSLTRRLVEKAVLALVSVAATELGRRAVHNAIDGRTPDGRLAVGHALEEHHRSVEAIPVKVS